MARTRGVQAKPGLFSASSSLSRVGDEARQGLARRRYTQIVERLFTQDFEYLRRLYEELNGGDEPDGPRRSAGRNPGPNGHAAGGPLIAGGKPDGLPRWPNCTGEMAFIAHHFHWEQRDFC